MKRLDKYVLFEAITPLIFGLLIYSSLAVVSSTLPRLKWIVGTPLKDLFVWFSLQMPQALVQTMPIALVLAVLLSFGRLSTNNELRAFRAGGISMLRLARVFLAIALILSALSLIINEYILPKTNPKVGAIYWKITSGEFGGLGRLARQDIPIGNMHLRFNKLDRKNGEILDIRIENWRDKKLYVTFAERARFENDNIRIFNYQVDILNLEGLNKPVDSAEQILKSLVKEHRVDNSAEGSIITIDESVDELITRHSRGGFEDSRSIRKAFKDANNKLLKTKDRRQAAILFHRKLAEPLANLALLLLALPLSLLFASNRGLAFGLSLIVTLVWYLLFTLGQLFAQANIIPVWFGVWFANFLLAAIGIYLLKFSKILS